MHTNQITDSRQLVFPCTLRGAMRREVLFSSFSSTSQPHPSTLTGRRSWNNTASTHKTIRFQVVAAHSRKGKSISKRFFHWMQTADVNTSIGSVYASFLLKVSLYNHSIPGQQLLSFYFKKLLSPNSHPGRKDRNTIFKIHCHICVQFT